VIGCGGRELGGFLWGILDLFIWWCNWT